MARLLRGLNQPAAGVQQVIPSRHHRASEHDATSTSQLGDSVPELGRKKIAVLLILMILDDPGNGNGESGIDMNIHEF